MLRRLALLAALALSPAGAAAMTIYTDSYPVAYFAERIAGDAAEVVFPVPPERDPAFWRPSIAEIGAFQAADLILLNGAGFADWTSRASLPPARTVDTTRGLADRFIVTEGVTHSHGPEGEHSHTATASFVWLDLTLAAEQARVIAATLGRRLPERAEAIDAGRNALIADLAGLDEMARSLPTPAPGTVIVTSHPRYQYFARAYELAIESVEWDYRETPDAEAWAAFDALTTDAGQVVMIWEAEPTPETRRALEGRGVVIAVLPTLANRPRDADFLDAFATGLAQLHDALAP